MGKLPHCWVDPWTSSRGQRTCCCFLHLGALFCLLWSRWGLPTAGGDPPLLAPMLTSPVDTLIGTPAIVFNLFSGHTETNTKWTLTGNVGLERPRERFSSEETLGATDVGIGKDTGGEIVQQEMAKKWRNLKGGERPDALRIIALRELSSREMEDRQVAQ